MGLIKAAASAVGSTLHDQWKEAIRCEEFGKDVLMKKVTTPNGVISNGSTIIVAPGQCAIIYDNGRIVDATAEDGVFTFDSSSTPSLFAGQFGDMFKEMWQRFTYNGATAKQQAVYFFNLKEITDNTFGTTTPVMYKDWGHPLMNARTNSYIGMSVKIKCYGNYTFKISDPFAFLSKFAGLADEYRKDQLVAQMKSEVLASFISVLNELGTDKYKVEALEITSKTELIKQMMAEKAYDEAIRNRGIQIITFNVEGVSLDDESNEKINNYELGGDVYSQQGTLTGAYANAIQDAAKNEGGMSGMFGVGMMNMATGNAFGAATTNAFAQGKPMEPQNFNAVAQTATVQTTDEVKDEPQKVESSSDTWMCPNCKKEVDGKFCSECGTKKPEGKKCSNCGKDLDENAKFCPECGTKV